MDNWPPKIGIESYYSDEYTVIYNADCREVLPLLPKVESVITDPPYGMRWENNQRFSGGNTRRGKGTRHRPIHGDDAPFDPVPWLQFERVVLWGANHFWGTLPPGSCLVWKKRNDHALGTFLSDAEIAFLSIGCGVYVFAKTFSGSSRAIDGGCRPYDGSLHPNQKPVSLMSWCIEKAGGEGVICDPYMGSGTTLRAAKDLRRRCIGIEIEEKYCAIAKERLRQEVLAL